MLDGSYAWEKFQKGSRKMFLYENLKKQKAGKNSGVRDKTFTMKTKILQ